MAIVDERLSYDFPQYMKDGMLLVLSKYPDRYQDIAHIRRCLNIPGKTVLNSCEAIILAGIVRPYYPPLTQTGSNNIQQLWPGLAYLSLTRPRNSATIPTVTDRLPFFTHPPNKKPRHF